MFWTSSWVSPLVGLIYSDIKIVMFKFKINYNFIGIRMNKKIKKEQLRLRNI